MGIIVSILIGCACGYLAGKITKGSGNGFWFNLLLGMVGGVIGSWVFGILGISWGGLIGEIATGTIGAIILLYIASLVRK